MIKVNFTFEGLDFEGHHVPPFTLRQSEVAVLQCPFPYDSPLDRHFVQLLLGAKRRSSLQLHKEIGVAEPLVLRWFLLGFSGIPLKHISSHRVHPPLSLFCSSKIVYERTGVVLTKQQESIVEEVTGYSSRKAIELLPATELYLLGIRLAWMKSSVITFTVGGLDPLGANSIYAYISQQIGAKSAVELSYPIKSSLGTTYSCFPGAKCIRIEKA